MKRSKEQWRVGGECMLSCSSLELDGEKHPSRCRRGVTHEAAFIGGGRSKSVSRESPG